MSEEIPDTDESDKEKNFAVLREKVEAYEARIAELAPLAVEKAVREAGFAPDTPEGKALSRLAGDTPDAESVKNLAVELGFEAGTTEPKHEPTPNERAAQEFANRASELNQVTTSDEPPNLQSQIAEAEQAGDWNKAVNLKLQMLTGQGG